MSSGKVDNEYVNDLEAKLTQARQEIRELMEEMKQLQEKQVNNSSKWCILEIPKRVPLQTVETQMKCSIMVHFI